MIDLHVENISVHADETVLIADASFVLQPGELVALLGPNGAGKTTLLRAALGLVKPVSGSTYLGGDEVCALSTGERARRVAYLPQTRPLAWPNIVRDVVALGRFAHGAALGRLGAADAAAVDQAIHDCDIAHLAERRTDTLSGGELARVHCARAFAAQAPLLIADEPVAALDPRHQFRVMDLIKSYVAQGGGALVVLHDVALAARYADRLIWMKGGALAADGTPADTLTPQRLAEIYRIRATVSGSHIQIEGAL